MEEESENKVIEQNGNLFFETESRGRIPLRYIFDLYEVRKKEAEETADLLDLKESEVREAIYCIHSEETDLYSRLEQDIEDSFRQEGVFNENKKQEKQDFDDLDGFKYLERDNGDLMVWDVERDDQKSIVEYAESIFTDFFDMGLDVEDIEEIRDLKRDQVREVVCYVENDVENMHELARESYEKRKEMERRAEGDIEDLRRRALRSLGNIGYRNYDGVLGTLQDFVEEEVDERSFKMIYSPENNETYRSTLEMHVLTDRDSDEAFYFGSDSEGQVYFGSTESEGEIFVDDAEDELTKQFVKQELNNLVL